MSESGRRQRIRRALHSSAHKPTPHYTITMLKKNLRAAEQPPMSAETKAFMREGLSVFNTMYTMGRDHFKDGFRAWDEDDFLRWYNYRGVHDFDTVKPLILRFHCAYQQGYRDAEKRATDGQ